MGDRWWLYGWVLLNLIQLLAIWIYPTYIAPLFNRFSPLSDPDLVARIEGLLQRTGFASAGLFVMDASKRSGHGNAYFTGIGPVKRIVFFDTLLTQLSGPQVEAVLAHELGHDKKHHIPKLVIAMAVLSFVAFAVLGWLIQQPWVFAGLGVQTPSTAVALILAVVCLPACTFMLDPVMAWWSRRHEFEADAYARWRSTQDGQPLRLPTENEWEHAAQSLGAQWAEGGNFLDSGALHPMPLARNGNGLQQMGGDVWEWTSSPFAPFAGFVPHPYRDYSQPWFDGRPVLKGASAATHPRMRHHQYRNYFTPERNDIFAGLRTVAA
jgi:EgtB-related family protein